MVEKEETPEEHKKCAKEVQDLWEEIENKKELSDEELAEQLKKDESEEE